MFLLPFRYGLQLKIHISQKYRYKRQKNHESFPNQSVGVCKGLQKTEQSLMWQQIS